MSKPGKSLKALCKKLGVRLTVKRGKKRVYKSVKVLKAQCSKKKKKVKRRRRKFGSGSANDLSPPSLANVFSPDSNYKYVLSTDLTQGTKYKFTILGSDLQQGLQGIAPSIKIGTYLGSEGSINGGSVRIGFDEADDIAYFYDDNGRVPGYSILEVHDLDNQPITMSGPRNNYLYGYVQEVYNLMVNPGANMGPPPDMGPYGPDYSDYDSDPDYEFGKRKKRRKKKKVVKKLSAALRKMCKKYKVRLTTKRGYKSEKVLKKQCKNKMKKKK